MKRVAIDIPGFWRELQRRRVVRLALWYIAISMAAIQVSDALLDAFERSELMPLVFGAIAAGFPLAIVMSWFFDLTPAGVERTAPLDPPASVPLPAPWQPPAGSLAVLPFANLGGAAEDEYFSDGLADEIRNALAHSVGLRVAARTSSFAFKNRAEDVREIARALNVAAVLEGGVRKQHDTVRIHVQLVGAADGYQLWSANYERRLEDIFRVQSEIATAVAHAVAPLSAAPAEQAPVTANFEAYNLYLRGRHHFHKRTEPALRRAVECFEQAIALDPGYALAYSGLGDACALQSSRFYGNLGLEELLAKALPAAERALALAPGLAEAHASLGLLRRLQGDLEGAAAALGRALELNPGYSMALVWRGLVLGDQGRFAEVEACDREALRVDPLSPIVNANVGFDRLRRGDFAAARERFEAASEIDNAFPVPHYGLARVSAAEDDLEGALAHLDAAIARAPQRGYYRMRRVVVLLQAGRLDEAATGIADACCLSPANPFDEDLVVAVHVARGEQQTLRCIVTGECARRFAPAPRAQAAIATGDFAAALALYAQSPPQRTRELTDLVTDDWVWRLPHVLNHAHLRHRAGDSAGATELEALIGELAAAAAQGIVSPLLHYWSAGAHAVLGREHAAREELALAARRGWRHAWWQQVDWNLAALGDTGA